jgi:hypothetical protein
VVRVGLSHRGPTRHRVPKRHHGPTIRTQLEGRDVGEHTLKLESIHKDRTSLRKPEGVRMGAGRNLADRHGVPSGDQVSMGIIHVSIGNEEVEEPIDLRKGMLAWLRELA